MTNVIIPTLLSFFLGPGVGQLYNREYKKGFLLIGASFLILIGAGIWYYKALHPYLPADLTTIDPAALQPILKNAADQVNAKDGYILSACEAVMTVLWLYGIVDAYISAQKKKTITNGRD
jgi:hypothetical protein